MNHSLRIILALAIASSQWASAATTTELNNPGSFTWNSAPWSAGIPNGIDNGIISSISGLMRGDGTVTISGTSTSTTPSSLLVGWQGNSTLTISGGTLTVGDSNGEGFAIGDSGNGVVTQSGGTVTAAAVRFARISGTGIYNLNGGALAAGFFVKGTGTSATLNLNGGTLRATTGGAWLGPNISTFVKAGGAIIDTQAFDVTVNSALLDDGFATNGGLRKISTGTSGGVLRLGAANTYTGDTNIDAGFLFLNVSNALPATSVVRLNNVAGALSRIELSGTSQRIAGLASGAVATTGIGTTDVYSTGAGASLHIATPTGQTYSFFGTVGNNGGPTSSNMTLTKSGGGTQIIGNTLNTGLTSVTGGILQIGKNDASASVGAGSYAVAAGAQLRFSRNADNARFTNQSISGGGDVIFQGQATGYFALRDGQFTGALSNSGNTTVNFDATTGGTLWNQRALWLEKDNVFSNASVLNIQSGKVILRAQTGTGLVMAGLTGNAGTFLTTDKPGVQKVTINTASGSYTYAGIIGADTFPGSPTNNNLSLTKTGEGTQILASTNTYTGTTAVQQGMLVFGANQTLTSLVIGADGIAVLGSATPAPAPSFEDACLFENDTAEVPAVPEPTAAAFLLCGIGLLAALRRRHTSPSFIRPTSLIIP